MRRLARRSLLLFAFLLIALAPNGCRRLDVLPGLTELEKKGWEPYDSQRTGGLVGYWPMTIDGDPNPHRKSMEVGLTVAQLDETFISDGLSVNGPVTFVELFAGKHHRYRVYDDSIFRPYWAWGLGLVGAMSDWEIETFPHEEDWDLRFAFYMRGGLNIHLGPFALGLGARYRSTATVALNSDNTDFQRRGKLTAAQFFATMSLQW